MNVLSLWKLLSLPACDELGLSPPSLVAYTDSTRRFKPAAAAAEKEGAAAAPDRGAAGRIDVVRAELPRLLVLVWLLLRGMSSTCSNAGLT